ncbi:MAG: Serine/threonine exchanger SteT [candidate division BRC1 bacterium ADurb.BinA364]|nr:MAG: Serine/threonine exchanger SteT [candidate division BRC1 bacterium ADurb.BinA364]
MSDQPKRQLTLFDSTSIIVGIIIGAGIYQMTPGIAGAMGGPAGMMAIWLAGGAMALVGALCYAELATAYPREGGDYIYQTRALGAPVGFLFGWSQMAIVRPGDIALMAFAFAMYAQHIFSPGISMPVYAAAAVVALTLINLAGIRFGKWTQNILTMVKIAGLLGIVAAGIMAPDHGAASAPVASMEGMSRFDGMKLALILTLFVYGGWNEMGYIAAEVKNPNRNIARALTLGVVSVTALYLLVNGAFLLALGYSGVASSNAVAVDAMAASFPRIAGKAIAILICISALGAANGLIFTGARISYALGTDHGAFRRLGRWNERMGGPMGALIIQGAISLAIIAIFQNYIDTIIYTAPVIWLFFLLTSVSFFVLRIRERGTPRPFRTPLFPLIPALFIAMCVFMLYSSVTYAWNVKRDSLLLMLSALALGVPALIASRRMEKSAGRQ